MTTKECYEKMGASYEDVLGRLGSEQIVSRFAKKFLNDMSFENLRAALDKKDVTEAFRAAHTLKGVCVNLGFNNLYKVSSELTEILRAGKLDGTDELFSEVEKQYDITTAAIRELE